MSCKSKENAGPMSFMTLKAINSCEHYHEKIQFVPILLWKLPCFLLLRKQWSGAWVLLIVLDLMMEGWRKPLYNIKEYSNQKLVKPFFEKPFLTVLKWKGPFWPHNAQKTMLKLQHCKCCAFFKAFIVLLKNRSKTYLP